MVIKMGRVGTSGCAVGDQLEKGMRELSRKYLACLGVYIGIYICQTLLDCAPKNLHFIVCKLYLNKKYIKTIFVCNHQVKVIRRRLKA